MSSHSAELRVPVYVFVDIVDPDTGEILATGYPFGGDTGSIPLPASYWTLASEAAWACC